MAGTSRSTRGGMVVPGPAVVDLANRGYEKMQPPACANRKRAALERLLEHYLDRATRGSGELARAPGREGQVTSPARSRLSPGVAGSAALAPTGPVLARRRRARTGPDRKSTRLNS